jgi:hypothetical protein
MLRHVSIFANCLSFFIFYLNLRVILADTKLNNLVLYQLDAQFSLFIHPMLHSSSHSVIYLYMFRALPRSSSGGPTVFTQ